MTQNFAGPIQPAQPPPVINKAYRSEHGKAHLPDPYLDPPTHDERWYSHTPPRGAWRVSTLCGRIIRNAYEAVSGDEMCGPCVRKGLRYLGAYEAAQGRAEVLEA